MEGNSHWPPEELQAHGTVLKVLCLMRRTQTDDFVIALRHVLRKPRKKKEDKKKHSASVFGPFSFLTSFTIRVKCLL